LKEEQINTIQKCERKRKEEKHSMTYRSMKSYIEWKSHAREV
jgi:hypothetical protein